MLTNFRIGETPRQLLHFIHDMREKGSYAGKLLLTGSRAYGTNDDDSDWDICFIEAGEDKTPGFIIENLDIIHVYELSDYISHRVNSPSFTTSNNTTVLKNMDVIRKCASESPHDIVSSYAGSKTNIKVSWRGQTINLIGMDSVDYASWEKITSIIIANSDGIKKGHHKKMFTDIRKAFVQS